jgi:hypothetical protein
LTVEKQPGSGGPSGELRHLTVMFCDLVGSTEIASRLDPEEWREILASYHSAVTEPISRFGGHAQYLSAGVMTYFGWPEAHDNNAERAARAGFERETPHPARFPGYKGLGRARSLVPKSCEHISCSYRRIAAKSISLSVIIAFSACNYCNRHV